MSAWWRRSWPRSCRMDMGKITGLAGVVFDVLVDCLGAAEGD
jgi:hypothetical protein